MQILLLAAEAGLMAICKRWTGNWVAGYGIAVGVLVVADLNVRLAARFLSRRQQSATLPITAG